VTCQCIKAAKFVVVEASFMHEEPLCGVGRHAQQTCITVGRSACMLLPGVTVLLASTAACGLHLPSTHAIRVSYDGCVSCACDCPAVCRMEPPPVFHGRWPVDGEPDNCRGMPVGGRCLAHCDCDPDECYALAGCPTAICQEDGTWWVGFCCSLGHQ
jgi:hypothetical protein